MTKLSITGSMEYLEELIGLEGLSAHNGVHHAPTMAASNVAPINRLQDAGWWRRRQCLYAMSNELRLPVKELY